MKLKSIIFILAFWGISYATYAQSKNIINSIIEESLTSYFNIVDSMRAQMNIPKLTERYVCSEGLPLGYDFANDKHIIYHDKSYNTIKKLKKNDKGIGSASVFLNFQDEYFVVSIVSRHISYKKKNVCEIQSSDSFHFKYKYDITSNTWKCVNQEMIAL